MRFFVSAAIVALPLLDIASLVEVGGRFGLWPTLGAVIIAFVAGSILMRAQGFAILAQAQVTLQEGRFPAREVFDGACVLFGSMLLMFPGFASDGIGIALLLPPVRALLRRLIGAQIRRSGQFAMWTVGPEGGSQPAADASGPVIDGESEPMPDNPAETGTSRDLVPRDASSPWTRVSPAAVVRSDDP